MVKNGASSGDASALDQSKDENGSSGKDKRKSEGGSGKRSPGDRDAAGDEKKKNKKVKS
jgi:hypothetical protein